MARKGKSAAATGGRRGRGGVAVPATPRGGVMEIRRAGRALTAAGRRVAARDTGREGMFRAAQAIATGGRAGATARKGGRRKRG